MEMRPLVRLEHPWHAAQVHGCFARFCRDSGVFSVVLVEVRRCERAEAVEGSR